MPSLRNPIIFLSLLICFIPSVEASSLLDNALDTLDRVIANQSHVLAARTARIDSIKRALPHINAQRIADEYREINNDSSIYYYTIALDNARGEGDTATIRRVLPKLSERLAKGSQLTNAFITLDTLDVATWTPAEKILYYSSLSHIYIDATNYRGLYYRRGEFTSLAIASLDSLLTLLPDKNSAGLVKAERYFLTGESALAFAELNDVLGLQDPFSPSYAIAANMLASYYKDMPEHSDKYAYYLALSAIADARRANGEAVSLVYLGEEMMKRGDFDRAFHYLAVAGELITDSNVTLYGAEIAPALTRFARGWSQSENKSRTIYLIIIALLALATCTAVLLYIRERSNLHKEKENEAVLSNSLSSREQYIGQLINVCGAYVEGFEEYNRFVGRKLKVNQTHELYEMIESGKILQEHNEHFFEVFDEAVHKIYPNFVAEINSLFAEDKQIEPQQHNRLTPELRILAFMRLGVTDSTKLSKFLGLSVNTVYTYRNRMKNRAKNRENFEAEIKNMGKNFR